MELGAAAVAIVLGVLPTLRAQAAGALAAVASQITHDLGELGGETLVVSAPLASDLAVTKPDELAARVSALVAGKLGPTARAHGQPLSLPLAHGVAGRTRWLVYVRPEIAGGQLRAMADVFPVVVNSWDRLRNPTPGPKAHAFAAAPIDAEVRTFLPAIPLEKATTTKAHHDLRDVLAIACGDWDGDGGLELVLVSRTEVEVGHVRGGQFVVMARAPWSSLSSRVAVPLREPLASVVLRPREEGGADLLLGTTDRAPVWVDAQLRTRGLLTGIPLGQGAEVTCASVNAAASAFDGETVPCSKGETTFSPPVTRFDALSAYRLVDRAGVDSRMLLARDPTGSLHAVLGERALTVDKVGAQIAACDLDQDGTADIVTTSVTAPDAVVISSWEGDALRTRLTIPAPDGVSALAVCPPEGEGKPAVVAAVGGEVWIVR